MLEAHQYTDNTFLTLTYSDASLPKTISSLPTLEPKHAQDWLKRFRNALKEVSLNKQTGEYRKMRFYLVGEYGDEDWRPHYHAALFNVPNCERGRTKQHHRTKRSLWAQCCPSCFMVGDTWGKGDITLGTLEVGSAQYVAGYVIKKMTASDDQRLIDRHPEFSRMSNRSGIGQAAMWEVADRWLSLDLDKRLADVPSALAHGKREMPLGRYLTKQLRKMVGRDEKLPDQVRQTLQADMLEVSKRSQKTSQGLKAQLLAENKGKLANFHARRKLFNNRGRS